jgi:hypothetical protein
VSKQISRFSVEIEKDKTVVYDERFKLFITHDGYDWVTIDNLSRDKIEEIANACSEFLQNLKDEQSRTK